MLTEFVRGYRFAGRRLDGIRYPTSTGVEGANVVLFATQADVVGGDGREQHRPWLRLERSLQRAIG